MVRALSEDLRVRVIEAVEAGASRREAAARFGVSVSSAIRWVAVWRASGRTRAAPTGGDLRSARIETHKAFLLAQVNAEPDVTLAELRERLRREKGVSVAISTLWRFLDRHRMTLKKNRARRRAGTSRPEGETPRLVRAATRSRSGAPRLHR